MSALETNIIHNFKKYWGQYLFYIKGRFSVKQDAEKNDLVYWQKELFIKTTATAIPISLLVIIPSMIIFWRNGARWTPVLDLLALTSILGFIFFTKFSIKVKMGFSLGVLTVLAVFLIGSLGSFGIGSIYLMAIGVLIALLFSDLIAYCSIALNIVILGAYAVVMGTDIVSWPVVYNYKRDLWLIYSLNFAFLNVMVVVGIRHLLVGLQNTLHQEDRLLKILQTEIAAKTIRNQQLAESEEHYKSLFFSNPSPMWIFDPESLLFLQVNEAAVVKYGFSLNEFLKMSIGDLQVDSIAPIIDRLKETLKNKTLFSNIALHKKKDGQQFHTKTKCTTIPFHGREALLVIAHDITTQVSHNKAIDEQNEKLKKIAYFQSHMVRAPLARIKGLWSLLVLEQGDVFDSEVSTFMNSSIEELDVVIKGIIKDSEIVSTDQHAGEDQRNSA